MPWHIHLAEESYQVEASLERFGKRPIHAIAALDVDMAQMIAVHGCWFDASERALLAERGGSKDGPEEANWSILRGPAQAGRLRMRVRSAFKRRRACG